MISIMSDGFQQELLVFSKATPLHSGARIKGFALRLVFCSLPCRSRISSCPKIGYGLRHKPLCKPYSELSFRALLSTAFFESRACVILHILPLQLHECDQFEENSLTQSRDHRRYYMYYIFIIFLNVGQCSRSVQAELESYPTSSPAQ